MKKIIIIFAPEYDPNSGGAIALHKLCHLLNEMNRKAYIFPLLSTRSFSIFKLKSKLDHQIKRLSPFDSCEKAGFIQEVAKPIRESTLTKVLKLLCNALPLKLARKIRLFLIIWNYNEYLLITNPTFNTPCFDISYVNEIANNDNYVVIYPEIVAGNPLQAKNVVRWLLHSPGFHTGQIQYGVGELYFRFSVETPYFSNPGSTTSEQFLTVVHFPTEIYNMNDANKERQGTAYCMRKGAGKEITHDLNDSICIDGKTHEEIAAIFKRVKTFYCYDTRTAYYYFASLCGCETIVIPDAGISEEQWLPDPSSRVGIRYGIDSHNQFSEYLPNQVRSFLRKEENLSIKRVENALREIDMMF